MNTKVTQKGRDSRKHSFDQSDVSERMKFPKNRSKLQKKKVEEKKARYYEGGKETKNLECDEIAFHRFKNPWHYSDFCTHQTIDNSSSSTTTNCLSPSLLVFFHSVLRFECFLVSVSPSVFNLLSHSPKKRILE